MNRPLPAAVLAALFILVDARRNNRVESFSMRTYPVGSDRYHVALSTDHRTLSVRYEPDTSRQITAARRIEINEKRIGELTPFVNQRFKSDDPHAQAKKAQRDVAKAEYELKKDENARLQEEIKGIEPGWREEFDLVALADQPTFVIDADYLQDGILDENDKLTHALQEIAETVKRNESETVADAVLRFAADAQANVGVLAAIREKLGLSDDDDILGSFNVLFSADPFKDDGKGKEGWENEGGTLESTDAPVQPSEDRVQQSDSEEPPRTSGKEK